MICPDAADTPSGAPSSRVPETPARLRFDICNGNLFLPPWSAGPRADSPDRYARVAQAGYRGLQTHEPVSEARAAGLILTGRARAESARQVRECIARHAAWGFESSTLHLGTGLERDAECNVLVAAALEGAAATGLPVFAETHRATIFQDMRRTLDLIERFPALRFTADFSHWYTGLEMASGNFEAKLAALEPVFRRVRFIHGRLASSGQIQLWPRTDRSELERLQAVQVCTHFLEMWSRAARGFLENAGPEETLVFASELLPAEVTLATGQRFLTNYALIDADGEERSDRWAEAFGLCRLMVEAFERAERREGLARLDPT